MVDDVSVEHVSGNSICSLKNKGTLYPERVMDSVELLVDNDVPIIIYTCLFLMIAYGMT